MNEKKIENENYMDVGMETESLVELKCRQPEQAKG